jgi:hypothetical protein
MSHIDDILLVLVLLGEEEIAVCMAGEALGIEHQVLMVRIRVVVINAIFNNIPVI